MVVSLGVPAFRVFTVSKIISELSENHPIGSSAIELFALVPLSTCISNKVTPHSLSALGIDLPIVAVFPSSLSCLHTLTSNLF